MLAAERFLAVQGKSETHGRLRIYFHGFIAGTAVKCNNRQWGEFVPRNRAKLLKIQVGRVHLWDIFVPRKTVGFFYDAADQCVCDAHTASVSTLAYGGRNGGVGRPGMAGKLLWRQWVREFCRGCDWGRREANEGDPWPPQTAISSAPRLEARNAELGLVPGDVGKGAPANCAQPVGFSLYLSSHRGDGGLTVMSTRDIVDLCSSVKFCGSLDLNVAKALRSSLPSWALIIRI